MTSLAVLLTSQQCSDPVNSVVLVTSQQCNSTDRVNSEVLSGSKQCRRTGVLLWNDNMAWLELSHQLVCLTETQTRVNGTVKCLKQSQQAILSQLLATGNIKSTDGNRQHQL